MKTISFFGPPAVAGRVLWIRVCQSFHSFILPSVWMFSWNWHISFFPETQHGGRPMWCYAWKSWDFWKKYFCTKNGENGPKMGQNYCFFEFIEKFRHCFFFGIWSIRKVCNICSILAQIPYLGKIWLLRYGLKRSWPIWLQDF